MAIEPPAQTFDRHGTDRITPATSLLDPHAAQRLTRLPNSCVSRPSGAHRASMVYYAQQVH